MFGTINDMHHVQPSAAYRRLQDLTFQGDAVYYNSATGDVAREDRDVLVSLPRKTADAFRLLIEAGYLDLHND